MSWNYRLVRRYYECPVDKVERTYLAIAEVYYTKKGKPRAFTVDLRAPTAPEHEDDPIADIRWNLEMQLEALDKPALDERESFGKGQKRSATGE